MIFSGKNFFSYLKKTRRCRRALFALFLWFFGISLLPAAALAATLSLDPKEGSVGPGDTFVITVRLDTTEGECINAAMVELVYPPEWMKASAVAKGESLLTLWPDEPKVDHAKGKVTFSGGIPAGYCGRVQGDPGKTNVLAKIIFSIPGNMIGGKVATGTVPLSLLFGQNTSVLLNDGFGTPASLTLQNAAYVRTLTSGGLTNEWLAVVHADTLPPDSFTPTITMDQTVFGGKHFLVFAAVDKQSGVTHYEVMEDDPERLGYLRDTNTKADFVPATSPHLLGDQTLKSRITVRAYDHAGNMQEAIILPTSATSTSTGAEGGRVAPYYFFIGGALLLLIGGAVLYTVHRKRGSMSVRDTQ